MAEPHFSTQSRTLYPVPAPPGNLPAAPAQGPQTPLHPPPPYQPLSLAYGASSSFLRQYPSPFANHMPDLSQSPPPTCPFPHESRAPPPYYSPAHPGHPVFSSLQPDMSRALHPMPGNAPPTPSAFGSPMPGSPLPDPAATRTGTNFSPAIEDARNFSPGYNLPMQPYFSAGPPPFPTYHSLSARLLYPAVPTAPNGPLRQRGNDGPPPAGPGHSPVSHGPPRHLEPPRFLASPTRRPSHERQHHQQGGGEQDRRPQPFPSPHSRRSDRSISPRNPNRRSFDRYFSDMGPSGSANDADSDAAAARMRVLHQRRERQRLVVNRRANLNAHRNTPTPSQMQTLRDKLPRFLLDELPEGVSTTCDICSKDYATTHVQPTEDTEVAVRLPCKHYFGQHCINTWFDTCKTHKNKITCPMCRKLLIEPVQRPASFGMTAAEMSQIVRDYGLGPGDEDFVNELHLRRDRNFATATALASGMLQGDFANS